MLAPLRPALLLAGLVLAALPASAQRRTALLSDAPPPPGRRCEVAKRPRALPALAAVADSAGLRQALAADSTLRGAAGSVLLSLRFDAAGTVEWVWPIEGDLPAGAQAAAQQVVQRFLRAGGRQPEPWSVRLRVQAGAAPELRLGRSEVCPVAILPGTVSRATQQLTPQEVAEMNRATESRIEVRVGTGGQALGARLTQSSGSRFLDDVAMHSLRDARFLPELVDGIPVETTYVSRSRQSR